MISLRVVLVDDHEVVRAGIRHLLTDQPDIVVVGEASDGVTALDIVCELRPDVVVMDLSMTTLNGIEATRRIIENTCDVPVLCLSMYADGHLVSEMLGAGASGYILKDSSPAEIVAAVRAVATGKTYLSAVVSDYVVRDYVASRQANRVQAPQLTHREYDVLQMIAEGHDTADIARLLSISMKTVSTHRGHIMQKLGLDNVVALTKYAIRHGISTAEPDTSESKPRVE